MSNDNDKLTPGDYVLSGYLIMFALVGLVAAIGAIIQFVQIAIGG